MLVSRAKRFKRTAYCRARTFSKIASPCSMSFLPIVSGGMKRRTLCAVALIKRPALRQSSTILPASCSSSMPRISPWPRTSRTKRNRRRISSRRFSRKRPIWTQFLSAPPRRSVSSTARPTLHASGFPPKVEAWAPGTKLRATFSLASMAPSGRPPPSAVMLVGEELSRPSHPRLHFVEDEENLALVAQVAEPLQIIPVGNDHAALPLDRLDENRDGRFFVDRRFHGAQVVVWDLPKSHRQRVVAGAHLLLSRRG